MKRFLIQIGQPPRLVLDVLAASSCDVFTATVYPLMETGVIAMDERVEVSPA